MTVRVVMHSQKESNMKKNLLPLAITLVTLVAPLARGFVAYCHFYQGVLKFTGCCPAPASFQMTFALYNVESNCSPLLVVTNVVPVETNGLFQTSLNFGAATNIADLFSQQLYLE